MCHRYQWDAIENEKKMSTHSSERRWGNKNVWLREHFLVTLQNIFSSIFRWIFIISFFSLLLDFATRLLTVLRAKISANQETVWCFASNHQQLSNLITQNVTHMPHTPRSTTLLVWSNHIHNNHKRKHYVEFSPRNNFLCLKLDTCCRCTGCRCQKTRRKSRKVFSCFCFHSNQISAHNLQPE